MKENRIVIVGGGMGGLTAAAYLLKAGYEIILLEKNSKCGGLLNSFQREGFTFDAGARSIENSGIIRPMLKDLGINLELLESPVSIGIENDVINFSSKADLKHYKDLLENYIPKISVI